MEEYTVSENHRKQGNWRLWYKQPAARWEEALPIGNGRIGAMVYGGLQEEVIALNEDTLWSGVPRDTQNYDALRHLKSARELIFSGKYKEAEELINLRMLGRRTESYQPLGNLRIQQLGMKPVGEYSRELDLQTGLASVQYSGGGQRFEREGFISAVDQVMVLRYTSIEGSLSLRIAMDSPLQHQIEAGSQGTLVMKGKAPSHIADNYRGDHPQSILYEDGRGLSFQAHIRVLAEGGSVAQEGNEIRVSEAGSVLILFTAATDFAGFDVVPGGISEEQLRQRCLDWLDAAVVKGYEELLNRHLDDHRALFSRVYLDLGSSAISELPTDERLVRYREGEEDPALEALYFQYGRYLLMASSRPGTQPANLQGIWNPHMQPPWNSNYTTNINVEMNYWPAEVGNLPECHEPLFDMIKDLSISGARTAKIHYGTRGWTAHHNVDLWRTSTPSDGDASWAFWPMSGVWLCGHLWERYAYSKDLDFLRDEAYPLMKGAAEFCLDWLIEDPAGRLVTAPSTSPENKFLTAQGEACSISAGSTMDLSLIRELLEHCIQAANLLDMDSEWAQSVRRVLEKLAKPEVAPDGRLREWLEDFPEAEPGHRHVSHLYGLYPGNAITPEHTPELAEAARKSLEQRIASGGGHTGWSCAWLINLYARLADGEQAYRFVRTLLARSTYPNLFDDHPPFQIDGNFGGVSGMAEMLMQSHLDDIDLLPALPSAWLNGCVEGIRARGGYTVDIAWEAGELTLARVTASRSGWCHIRYAGKKLRIAVAGKGTLEWQEDRFKMEPGDCVIVTLDD